MNRLIIVEGLPCSGKSTVSKYIADRAGAVFYDEGSGEHPADYEFHAYLSERDLGTFSAGEQALIRQQATPTHGGYIVPIGAFSGAMCDRLIQYKIYDFLPWETERPLMLGKWEEFVKSADKNKRYVFNCVLLQNPMCETMMRFGSDRQVSFEHIKSICDIIRPMEPFVVYLKMSNIRAAIEKALPERGNDWLDGVINYHCGGAYGKANHLSGFDGYIAALEERQRRETEILTALGIEHMILDDPCNDWERAYAQMAGRLRI